MCAFSSYAVPPPCSSVELATALRPGSPVSDRVPNRGRHTHIWRALYDDPDDWAVVAGPRPRSTETLGKVIDDGPTGRSVVVGRRSPP